MDYNNSSTGNVVIRYGDMKKQLAEDMIKFLEPVREKTNAMLADNQYLADVMKHSRDKARSSAAETLQLVRKAVGMQYY
jgi:tryptophanyl-tRNA synthetase